MKYSSEGRFESSETQHRDDYLPFNIPPPRGAATQRGPWPPNS